MGTSEYNRIYNSTDKGRTIRIKCRDKRRAFIYSVLGNVCKHCGFSDKRALQMDHIHGRKGEKRLGNIDKRYQFVKNNPELAKQTYQILCANCNFIKREENQEHYYHGRKPISI